MKEQKIQIQGILTLFIGVALFADLLPWPGLGSGLIQSFISTLNPEESPQEKVLNSQQPSIGREEAAQHQFSLSPSNGG